MDKKVFLKPTARHAPRFGHPWVYRSQIQEVSRGTQPGDLVEVHWGRRNVGIGYFNPKSEIIVRLLSSPGVWVDKGFFKAKIAQALEFRKERVRETNAYRVVSSEADDLPGLIVDRYGEILVVQFLTLGMDRLRPWALEALEETIPSKGIYEKSNSASRRIEGLEERTGWISKSCGGSVEIFERDLRFELEFGQGHKTGFYLDQRENRLHLRDLGLKGEALDAFCYEGAFGLHLAKGGMRVLGIEIQPEAVSRAQEHRRKNGISEESLRFKAGNSFDELKALEKEKRKFDLVILDPPSFVKKKSALEGALAGYKEILLRSMKLLNEGGHLAVFTCSYHLDESLLMQTAMQAAMDVRKGLRVVKFLKQSADHPINPFIPETYYLKGFLFAVSAL